MWKKKTMYNYMHKIELISMNAPLTHLSWEWMHLIYLKKIKKKWQRNQLFSTVIANLALCKVKYTVKMLSVSFLLAIGSLTVTLACENGNHLPDGRKCPSTGLHVRILQITSIIKIWNEIWNLLGQTFSVPSTMTEK